MAPRKKPKKVKTDLKSEKYADYFNPRAPGSFGGVDALYRQIDEKSKVKRGSRTKTKSELSTWLRNQPAYSMHFPVKRKFKRNITMVYTINEQFQADLIDMSSLSKQNGGVTFLLSCIDIFSKYAWVIPLRNKSGISVKLAFEKIFAERKPEKLQTDQGKDFENSECKALFEKLGINHFNALSGETHCAVAERFNRTFKTKMWKYMTHKNTHTYIDVMEDLVHSYNHTYHTAIKMKPAEVNDTNVKQVWQNLYGTYFRKEVMGQTGDDDDDDEKKKPKPEKKPKFQVGDHVRLSGERVVFRKGYENGWTEEVYTVSKIFLRRPTVYVVKDEKGEELRGVFYEPELLKIGKPETYVIEKILKTEGVGKNKKHLVKWRGYPKSFNSWVPQSDIVDI